MNDPIQKVKVVGLISDIFVGIILSWLAICVLVAAAWVVGGSCLVAMLGGG